MVATPNAPTPIDPTDPTRGGGRWRAEPLRRDNALRAPKTAREAETRRRRGYPAGAESSEGPVYARNPFLVGEL